MSDTDENHDQGNLEDQLRKSVERWIRHHPLQVRPQDIRAGEIFLLILIGGPMVGAIFYIVVSKGLPLPILLSALAFIGVFLRLILFD